MTDESGRYEIDVTGTLICECTPVLVRYDESGFACYAPGPKVITLLFTTPDGRAGRLSATDPTIAIAKETVAA